MNVPNLVPYTVRLYRSGPKADTFTEAELEHIQQGHLDFVASQRSWTHANGPFREQPDQTLRGFGIMRSGIEETLAAVQADPGRDRGTDARRGVHVGRPGGDASLRRLDSSCADPDRRRRDDHPARPA